MSNYNYGDKLIYKGCNVDDGFMFNHEYLFRGSEYMSLMTPLCYTKGYDVFSVFDESTNSIKFSLGRNFKLMSELDEKKCIIPKFKVGDKVRIKKFMTVSMTEEELNDITGNIGKDIVNYFNSEFEIRDINNCDFMSNYGSTIFYRFVNCDYDYRFRENLLELVEEAPRYKVGDRVIVKPFNEYDDLGGISPIHLSRVVNEAGTIVDASVGENFDWYSIDFDDLELSEYMACFSFKGTLVSAEPTSTVESVTVDEFPKRTVEDKDNVNHPSHYTQGKFEVIDVIEDATKNLTGIEAVCVGNILKYILRYQYKNGHEDVLKAKWYLNKLIEEFEK